eukprot:2509877-Pyramimonas_sp.AAC.1
MDIIVEYHMCQNASQGTDELFNQSADVYDADTGKRSIRRNVEPSLHKHNAEPTRASNVGPPKVVFSILCPVLVDSHLLDAL